MEGGTRRNRLNARARRRTSDVPAGYGGAETRRSPILPGQCRDKNHHGLRHQRLLHREAEPDTPALAIASAGLKQRAGTRHRLAAF
jgi:hypothetical protein